MAGPACSADVRAAAPLHISGTAPGAPLVADGVLPVVRDGALVLDTGHAVIRVSPWPRGLPRRFAKSGMRAERQLDPAGASDTIALYEKTPENPYLVVQSGARLGTELPLGGRFMKAGDKWVLRTPAGNQVIAPGADLDVSYGRACWRLHVQAIHARSPAPVGIAGEGLPSVDWIGIRQAGCSREHRQR